MKDFSTSLKASDRASAGCYAIAMFFNLIFNRLFRVAAFQKITMERLGQFVAGNCFKASRKSLTNKVTSIYPNRTLVFRSPNRNIRRVRFSCHRH